MPWGGIDGPRIVVFLWLVVALIVLKQLGWFIAALVIGLGIALMLWRFVSSRKD
jgi:hypothetical protein